MNSPSLLRGVEVGSSRTKWWGVDRHIVIYFVTTAIYLCLAILLRQVLNGVGWWLFPRRAAR